MEARHDDPGAFVDDEPVVVYRQQFKRKVLRGTRSAGRIGHQNAGKNSLVLLEVVK